ncbi:MAG: 30S ribosomal protein S6 [Thermomicrobiales bacterium]
MASPVRDPRAYELMVMIVPDISDEEVAEELGRINTYIGDVEGTISEVLTDSPWGRRRLAYTIRFNSIDYRDGYYAVYHFQARPDVIAEIERELKLDTRIIRYLLVHDDPKAGVQSANNPAEASDADADDRRRPAAPAEGAPATEAAPAEASAPAATAEETPAAESTAAAEEPVATEDAPAAAEDTPEPEPRGDVEPEADDKES